MSRKRKNNAFIFVALCCALTIVFSFVDVSYSQNERVDKLVGLTTPLLFGSIVVAFLLKKEKSGLFSRPCKLLFLLPCLLVAVNNFPFVSYFTGKSAFDKVGGMEIFSFVFYCVLVGFFEEGIFRGIVFPLLAERFPKNRKGVILTFFLSSGLFGLAHLFNLFAGAGIGGVALQVCYSTLIGGLCAFALMKTKNLLCCAFVHTTYNICGLALDLELGLGLGVVFDLPTALMMAGVGVAVGIFVLYGVFTYSEEERICLYQRLGFGITEREYL